jgi:hypothetical protein
VSLDRKDRTDQDMTARKDMGVRRTVDKVVLAGHLEQDSWDRTAGTRRLLDTTAGTGQPEQDRRDRTASSGKP